MELSNLIKQYRANNNLTLREFATKCGTSHSYIAMLENNKNSKTGEPIVPTLTMLNKISQGLGMSVNELISTCDDMPISLSPTAKLDSRSFATNKTPLDQLTEGEKLLLEAYRRASDDVKPVLINVMEALESMPLEKLKAVVSLLN
jgi:transcriptional regulator with XRE-family HTH domain